MILIILIFTFFAGSVIVATINKIGVKDNKTSFFLALGEQLQNFSLLAALILLVIIM